MDEDYKKALELWVKDEQVYIDSLRVQADYLEKSIRLDKKHLELTKEMIDHEERRLASTIDELNSLPGLPKDPKEISRL